VLANGEKVVPVPTEGTIVSHEAVRGAVMFGRERNQVGVLVEPDMHHTFDPADETALAKFRNLIWCALLVLAL
jgi:long-subunit acyl-CoA synthetase (AMP-forming)